MSLVIDFITAITLFISCVLLLVIGHWLMYNNSEDARASGQKKSTLVIQCPYCSTLFFDSKKSFLPKCPRCQSYVDKKESLKKEK